MTHYPKAYLRIDPNIDQVRVNLDAFIRLLCAANRQPERGYFKSEAIARMVLGKSAYHRAVNDGDLLAQPDGRLYVDGWTDWQEGDLNVGERMRRLRSRKRDDKSNGRVTPIVTTPDVKTLRRLGVLSSSNEEDSETGVTVDDLNERFGGSDE